MPVEMSNRVILITELPRITTTIKLALNKIGAEIITDYPAITSISVMRTGIAKSGKTAFIRTELMRFIKEKGFPRAIILDSRLHPSAVPDKDADSLKILKTFLIAYIILQKGEGYSGLHGNFILLTKGNTFNKETGLGSSPHSIMKLLSTQNPEINLFIEELKDNKERFDSLFSIHLMDTEQSSDVISDNIVKMLVKGDRSGAAAASADVPAPEAVHEDENNAAEAAHVLYKLDEGTLYDDAEIITELTGDQLSLKEKEIYISGSWVSGNELEVAKKIATLILKGVEGKLRFSYNDVITINMDDMCVIDKNTTLSAAQLFTKNLAAYKKIKIITSPKNGELMQKSRGFPMIREIFSVAE